LRALPTARIGGADTAGAGGDYTRAFIEHQLAGVNTATGKTGNKFDFVAFHAKGAPTTDPGFVRMGINAQLSTIDEGFRIIASYPELEGLPVIIGESDPEGCAACKGDALAYRNGAMYASYTAASFARKHALAERHGVNLEGALTWAFTFEDQPYFAGFRSLASNGLDKPVLNVFRMYARMGGTRVRATSDHEVPLDLIVSEGVRDNPDVAAIASRDGRTVSALLWHYHDDMVPGPDADVSLRFENLPAEVQAGTLRHFRIDDEHSNAYEAWVNMGSPVLPSPEQYSALVEAGKLQMLQPERVIAIGDRTATVRFPLPRRAVSLLEFELDNP
jgi:xylan 1,4-beta-xylosidase